MEAIHPTAVVAGDVSLGADCRIGPYCVVESGAVIGDRCRLDSHAVLKSGCELGEGVAVHSGAVIGGDPQDFHFDPAVLSRVVVGAGSTLREGVTVHRSAMKDGVTRLGRNVYLMACAHVAHDCLVGDRVVMANGALLAGHVRIGNDAFLGGLAAVHQFCRVGDGVMVGGHAAVSKDVPPGLMVVGRDRLAGLNLVGLKRRRISAQDIGEFKAVYRDLYARPGNIRKNARARLDSGEPISPLARGFLEFFLEGTRGFAVPASRRAEGDEPDWSNRPRQSDS